MQGKRAEKFYITTSIPYANAAPHVGHILDPLIADVLARYHRVKGYEVRFLAGTDEHGAKIARAAEAAGKTPQELVDENSQKFREMHRLLGIEWDDFIRTSDRKRHWPGAQKMWRALKDAGDIYWNKYRGLYCVGHEAFITEKDLVSGKCADHQREPEAIEEENWFFRLSKYTEAIRSRIEDGTLRIVPESRKNEILSFIADGLEDVSCSRPRKDLSWGVTVPDDPTQTMYVWLEALTSYISSLGYGQESQLPVLVAGGSAGDRQRQFAFSRRNLARDAFIGRAPFAQGDFCPRFRKCGGAEDFKNSGQCYPARGRNPEIRSGCGAILFSARVPFA